MEEIQPDAINRQNTSTKNREENNNKSKNTSNTQNAIENSVNNPLEPTRLSDEHQKCHLCDHIALSSFALRSHMECVHYNLMRYKCSKCIFITNNQRYFRAHMKYSKHTNYFHKNLNEGNERNSEEPQNCPLCDFVAPTSFDLIQHEGRIHEGWMSYNCPKCPLRTDNKRFFIRHLKRTKHSELYYCANCEYRTIFKGNIRHHCFKHLESLLPSPQELEQLELELGLNSPSA